MLRWRGLDSGPGGWGRSVVTIGVFDGVHRGHQQIIGHTVKRARETGVPAVVMTFDPHPAEVVRPGSHPAVLTEPGRKADLIAGLGVDALCVIPFTLDEAVALADLEGRENPVTVPLATAAQLVLPRRDVDAAAARVLSHGGPLPAAGTPGPYAVFDPEGQVVAVVAERDGKARPEVVFKVEA